MSRPMFLQLTGSLFFASLLAATTPLRAQIHYESLTWTPGGEALTVSLEGDLFVLPLDGGHALQLTHDEGRDVAAAWSPDGSAVAFASDRDGDSEIYVAAADGSGLRALTQNEIRDSWPSWSPDGTRIAFMRKSGAHYQIWLMAADGSSQQQLIESDANDYNPRWSPDGRWLVFESDRDGGDQDEIYVVGADGRGERRLTDTRGNDIYPEWSPAGDRIAYCTIEEGRAFVHAIPVDGGEPQRIAEDACKPVWSPDGSRIAFASILRGQPEKLWVARADGSAREEVPGPRDRTIHPGRAETGSEAGEAQAEARAPAIDPSKPNVAILIYDGVQIIDHTAPWEVLGQYSLNNVYTVAKDTTPVTTFMGMRVLPSYGFADYPKPDVIVIPGGNAGDARADPEIIEWIHTNAVISRFVLGICSGVSLLAEADLLAGRRATTFYNLLDDLAEHPSDVTVVEDELVVEDGKYVTTTGTGVEGALRVSELLHGAGWTRVVSLNMEFEPLPDDERTPRAWLADMNMPSSIYGAFPWRTAELAAYEGDKISWIMTWRFEGDGDLSPLIATLSDGLAGEGWTQTLENVRAASWTSEWTLVGRDESPWTGRVQLKRLADEQLEMTIEVRGD